MDLGQGARRVLRRFRFWHRRRLVGKIRMRIFLASVETGAQRRFGCFDAIVGDAGIVMHRLEQCFFDVGALDPAAGDHSAQAERKSVELVVAITALGGGQLNGAAFQSGFRIGSLADTSNAVSF